MSFFNRGPPAYGGGYGGMPPRRSGSGRTILLILGVIFGLYFLNLSFQWIKISESVSTALGPYFNGVVGVLLIVLGLMAGIKPRVY
ncbi:Uncharacterised protein [uncultured archaeon]|nr:Uncharacterised protein [uncultured archaeon]